MTNNPEQELQKLDDFWKDYKQQETDFQKAAMERGQEIHQKVEDLIKDSPLKEQIEEMVLDYFNVGIEFGGMVERWRQESIKENFDLMKTLLNEVID